MVCFLCFICTHQGREGRVVNDSPPDCQSSPALRPQSGESLLVCLLCFICIYSMACPGLRQIRYFLYSFIIDFHISIDFFVVLCYNIPILRGVSNMKFKFDHDLHLHSYLSTHFLQGQSYQLFNRQRGIKS